MSDAYQSQIRRVSDHDRLAARESLQRLMAEAATLGGLISRSLGRDAVDISRGFTIAVNTDMPPSAVPGLGVGVSIICNNRTGECIGVMDDFAGVSRPCTTSEATHCIQCGVEPTDPEVLKTLKE